MDSVDTGVDDPDTGKIESMVRESIMTDGASPSVEEVMKATGSSREDAQTGISRAME